METNVDRSSLHHLAATSLILVLLAGCGLSPTTPAAIGVGPTASQSPSSTPNAAPFPAATLRLTPTSALVMPLAPGNFLPQLENAISSDNATRMVEIARWGRQTEQVGGFVFVPDGKILALLQTEDAIELWDPSINGEPISFSGHTGRVTSVAFSADGKMVASGSEDNEIKLWDVASGQELRTLGGHKGDLQNRGVLYVAFSPDGRTLVSVSEAVSRATSDYFFYLDLWDVSSGKQTRTWSSFWIRGVAFSQDGKLLAWGTSNVYWADNNVVVSDLASGREIRILRGHTSRVNGIAFSPDGKTLASGSDDSTVRLWDVESGVELRTLSNVLRLPGADDIPLLVAAVAFSPDGRTLASATEPSSCCAPNETVTLWDVPSGQELGPLRGFTDYSAALAFSQDGRLLGIVTAQGTLRLWGVYP